MFTLIKYGVLQQEFRNTQIRIIILIRNNQLSGFLLKDKKGRYFLHLLKKRASFLSFCICCPSVGISMATIIKSPQNPIPLHRDTG